MDGNPAPAVQLCAVEARHQSQHLPPRQSFHPVNPNDRLDLGAGCACQPIRLLWRQT